MTNRENTLPEERRPNLCGKDATTLILPFALQLDPKATSIRQIL